MRNKAKKTAGIAFGIITAVILIVSQLFCHQSVELGKKEQKTEKHSKESTNEESALFIVASNAPTPSIQTQIHQEVIFLFEILFLEDEKHSWTTEVPIALGKYFLTLFHIIISPNAP